MGSPFPSQGRTVGRGAFRRLCRAERYPFDAHAYTEASDSLAPNLGTHSPCSFAVHGSLTDAEVIDLKASGANGQSPALAALEAPLPTLAPHSAPIDPHCCTDSSTSGQADRTVAGTARLVVTHDDFDFGDLVLSGTVRHVAGVSTSPASDWVTPPPTSLPRRRVSRVRRAGGGALHRTDRRALDLRDAVIAGS